MRRGFTLLEMMLVLAVMVVIAGVAVPTYRAYILGNEIASSAGRLELEVRKARLEAIRTGQIQVMRVTLGEREATLQPWLSTDDAASASGGATVMTNAGQVVTTDSQGMAVSASGVPSTTWSVGQSVHFENAQIFTDMRSVVQTGTNAMVGASGVSSPIFFYPDGSSSTARIVLVNTRGRRIAVEIRGVTGSTQTVELVPTKGTE